MLKTAEAVSIGHPDKTADYISSYILDRLIEQDPSVRYAVEVMVKNNTVVLGGEVAGHVDMSDVYDYVRQALCQIGYDERYAQIWKRYAIDINQIKILNLIGLQSSEIDQGVRQNGWGDQGVFVGFACQGDGFISRELFLAKKLNKALYTKARQNDNLGIDIKTQITLATDGHVETVIVAIPMLKHENMKTFICQTLGEEPDKIIINGTGLYQTHSSIADCGITGRKLACDFYSTACPIGGGSPWTKDASKADLTLNLYARKLAVQYLADNDECFVYLSSCIGVAELPSAVVKVVKDGKEKEIPLNINKTPTELIESLGLHKPIFAKLCFNGLMEFENLY